jgi:hypothetical protein
LVARDLQAVFDSIRHVEQKFNLVNFKSGDVFIWPVIRLRVIRVICESVGIYAPTPKQPSIFDKDSTFISSQTEAIYKLVMSGKLKSKSVVIPFLRRNQHGEDLFTKRIVSSLEDPFVFGVGEADAQSEKLSLDFISKFFEKKYRKRALMRSALGLRLWHNKYWRQVITELEDLTGADLSQYLQLPKWLMVEFHSQRIGFRKLLKKLETKTVFYVNAYNSAFIAGAKQSGAWVVEPQHGLLSNLHSTLSWPTTPYVDYQPDEVLVWGQYWADAAKLAENVKTTVIGWSPSVPREDAANRKTGTIAFISQPEHSQVIAQMALKTAKAHPELKVLLKLHPKDSPINMATPENLQIVGSSISSQILGTRCEYVVGVSSMALAEAASLGAKVSLIDFPGHEHLKPLIALGAATLVRGNFDVSAVLRDAKVFDDSGYLFAPELGDAEFKKALNGKI